MLQIYQSKPVTEDELEQVYQDPQNRNLFILGTKTLNLNELFEGKENNIYLRLINEIFSGEKKLDIEILNLLKGIIHLPSMFTILSVVSDIITNEDESGVMKFIIDELQK